MPANVQTEINAINKIMADKRPELLVQLGPEYFGNEDIKNLFNLIKRFYTEKGTWIGWDVLNAIISKAARSPERVDYLLKLILKIRERDTAGLTEEDLLKELSDYRSLRTVMGISEELVSAVEQKDAAKVVSLYKKGYEQICFTSVNDEDSDIGSLSFADTPTKFRTTGIAPLDERSGFAEGALILLGGDSGTGKSTMAHCIGVHNYDNYPGSVAYWTYEQGRKEIMSRVWSRTSQVDLGNIISNNLTTEEKWMLRKTKADFLFKNVQKELEKPLEAFNTLCTEHEYLSGLYKEYEPRDNKMYIYDDCLDFDSLLMKMELLYAVKNVKVFIVDYITLIPRGRLERQLQQWEYHLYKSAMLKTFARKHGDVIVITPVQFDAKEDKLRLASNMINDADVCLTMKQTDADKGCDLVTVSFKKYRNFTGAALKDFKLLKAFDKAGFEYIEM